MRADEKTWFGAIISDLAGRIRGEPRIRTGAGVTGTWRMTVEAETGPGTPVFALIQNGEELRGTYKGRLGKAPVTGSVKGNQVVMIFQVDSRYINTEATYSGTVDGDSMCGHLVMENMGKGTFTGTRL